MVDCWASTTAEYLAQGSVVLKVERKVVLWDLILVVWMAECSVEWKVV